MSMLSKPKDRSQGQDHTLPLMDQLRIRVLKFINLYNYTNVTSVVPLAAFSQRLSMAFNGERSFLEPRVREALTVFAVIDCT